MGKVKEMKFPEEIIHSTNKIPNDPEVSFKKFADIIGSTKATTLTGDMEIKEVGPREGLSSKFQLGGKTTFETFITLQFIISKKLIEIGYEVLCTSEAGEKKQIMKASTIVLKNMISSTVERAYDKAVGEDFTLIGKKEKKKKKSRSEKLLDAMMNPEQEEKLGKMGKIAIKQAKEHYAAMQAEKVTDGSMCYLHPDVAADVRCDLCKKPICAGDLQNPLDGQKLYLKGKKELKKVPFSVCPNCVKEAKKKYGPKSWSQIRGYMASH